MTIGSSRCGAGADPAGTTLGLPRPPRRGTFVVFRVAGHDFGLPVEQVRSVQRAVPPLALPGARPSVRGVVNLRGTIVAVHDPRVVLELGGTFVPDEGRVLVVEHAGVSHGLQVDAVDGVEQVGSAAVHPLPEGTAAAEALVGVVDHEGGRFVLLDLGLLLGEEDE